MKAVLGQLRAELVLSLRNGEQLLVGIGIPLLVLLFFPLVRVIDTPTAESIDYYAPAVLALAVMSSSLVSLGVGTGFDRQYGVLKRLGATPLGRPRWVVAKIAMVFVTELLQFAVLIPAALLLGWSPAPGWAGFVAAVVLGTSAFGGLGLLMAGTLPGLANLAATNLVYVVLVATGGMTVPLGNLPGAFATVARLLPAAALTDAVTGSLIAGWSPSGRAWAVLAAWAVVTPAAAATRFRWE